MLEVVLLCQGGVGQISTPVNVDIGSCLIRNQTVRPSNTDSQQLSRISDRDYSRHQKKECPRMGVWMQPNDQVSSPPPSLPMLAPHYTSGMPSVWPYTGRALQVLGQHS